MSTIVTIVKVKILNEERQEGFAIIDLCDYKMFSYVKEDGVILAHLKNSPLKTYIHPSEWPNILKWFNFKDDEVCLEL